jgi:S-DNA-T family DNA segregation ATPase FtsK/SpoIIIE
MRNVTTSNSNAKKTAGKGAAAILACTLAAVGCTTVLNPDSSSPYREPPAVGPMPPTSSPGAFNGANVPMVSAYYATEPATVAVNRAEFRTRYLGSANPGPANASDRTPVAAQPAYPNPNTSRQYVANTPVVIGDLDSGGLVLAVPAATIGTTATSSGTTTNSSTTPAGAAAVIATPAPTVAARTFLTTPTMAAATVTNPTAAAAGQATMNSAAVVSPTTSAAATMNNTATTVNPPMASSSTTGSTVAIANTGIPATGGQIILAHRRAVTPASLTSGSMRVATATSRLRAVSPMLGGNGTSRIHIVRGSNGAPLITNQTP